MRIRSALAAAVMTVALTAAGAATATAAHDDPRHRADDGPVPCDSYFGGIDTSSSGIFWGGSWCRDHH